MMKMMNKKEKLINDIRMNCEANKLIIVDNFREIKDINSKDEVKEVMLRTLNIIDNDESNEEAIYDFFDYIDNKKDKTYQDSYKEEAEDSLLEFIFSNRDDLLKTLEAEND